MSSLSKEQQSSLFEGETLRLSPRKGKKACGSFLGREKKSREREKLMERMRPIDRERGGQCSTSEKGGFNLFVQEGTVYGRLARKGNLIKRGGPCPGRRGS